LLRQTDGINQEALERTLPRFKSADPKL
jgi:hypothetical protein